MRVLFLRHGESRSNAAKDLVALPDADGDRLTDTGREQSSRSGRHLRDAGVTRILTSPLRRARETAELVGLELGMAPEVLPELAELRESTGYGGLTAEDQIARRWSVWMSGRDDPDYSWQGGESFGELVARVRRVKGQLAGTEDDLLLAVTHGIFLRFFLADSVIGEGFRPRHVQRLWQFQTSNCGLSVFEHATPTASVDPKRPALGDWTCVSWMSRPWETR